MFRRQSARLATGVVGALLGVMLLGVGGVAANPPGWAITASADLPTTVSPGALAGYSFTIKNNGTSNIAQLYLTAGYPAAYFAVPLNDDGSSHPCLVYQNSPNLFCSLGALNSLHSISFVVAFTAPTSGTSFDPLLEFNTTGATTSDGSKNTSHGDTLHVLVSTAINSSPDFAGTFTPDTSTVSTNTSLGKKNIQATSVNPPSAHLAVTADDSGTVTFNCGTSTACTNAFGVWSALHVKNSDGTTYVGSAFQVTLLVLGQAVPGGVTASEIEVLHVLDNGTVETLTQTGNACPATPSTTTADCIQSVTKVGNNFQIVLWLIQNGGLKSSF